MPLRVFNLTSFVSIVNSGIFAENIIEVAKRELRWEVDYMREMECAKRFRILLQPYPDYYIPEVIGESGLCVCVLLIVLCKVWFKYHIEFSRWTHHKACFYDGINRRDPSGQV